MRQTWRWFGENDRVSLCDARQAGAEGIVTALYAYPPGQIWSPEDIIRTKSAIESEGLTWDVVESLPISEAIRTADSSRDADIDSWIASMRHLAESGLKTICYNFMPVLDWTRTHLRAERPSGAKAMAFDLPTFAAFDIYHLKRPNAVADYDDKTKDAATKITNQYTQDDWLSLTNTILKGLPGAVESWTLEGLKERLKAYADIDVNSLRRNLQYFLQAVVPEAEALNMRLCCHPDDPPWPIFGLPRIISTLSDYEFLINAAPSPSNGVTFCTGSLGARHDNDLADMVKHLGPHIHFAHLRNVKRANDNIPCSFFEDDHLAGSTDMASVIAALLAEQEMRKVQGRSDWQIPMRPDHGQDILDDHCRKAAPGYPAIGRLKGLAELRGVMAGLNHANTHTTRNA